MGETKNPPDVQKMIDHLFLLVEGDQGFAHISDGIVAPTFGNLVEIVERSLYHTGRVQRKLKKWLKDNGVRK